jgi:hypothetical protein
MATPDIYTLDYNVKYDNQNLTRITDNDHSLGKRDNLLLIHKLVDNFLKKPAFKIDILAKLKIIIKKNNVSVFTDNTSNNEYNVLLSIINYKLLILILKGFNDRYTSMINYFEILENTKHKLFYELIKSKIFLNLNINDIQINDKVIYSLNHLIINMSQMNNNNVNLKISTDFLELLKKVENDINDAYTESDTNNGVDVDDNNNNNNNNNNEEVPGTEEVAPRIPHVAELNTLISPPVKQQPSKVKAATQLSHIAYLANKKTIEAEKAVKEENDPVKKAQLQIIAEEVKRQAFEAKRVSNEYNNEQNRLAFTNDNLESTQPSTAATELVQVAKQAAEENPNQQISWVNNNKSEIQQELPKRRTEQAAAKIAEQAEQVAQQAKKKTAEKKIAFEKAKSKINQINVNKRSWANNESIEEKQANTASKEFEEALKAEAIAVEEAAVAKKEANAIRLQNIYQSIINDIIK